MNPKKNLFPMLQNSPYFDPTALNARVDPLDALGILGSVAAFRSHIPIVSSFGAESAVLLHMASRINPDWPVIFIDTHLLFSETLVYQQTLCDMLGMRNITVHRAQDIMLALLDQDGQLHKTNPDACCDVRKTQVLNTALKGFDGWITGRKQYQSATRAELMPFERDTQTTKFKVNPLARWDGAKIATYFAQYALPRHPLVAQGYPSIGCAPCTSPVKQGENPRAGRWRGQSKTECGIHFAPQPNLKTGEPE